MGWRGRWGWFEERKDYGMLFVRLIVGFHLIYGTQDNVFDLARMHEFRDFLQARGVPFPLAGAFLSAYAQFICGCLFILGAVVREAALVMVVNFVCALFIAHRVGGYPPAALALLMLFSSLALLFHGAGRPSLAAWRARANA